MTRFCVVDDLDAFQQDCIPVVEDILQGHVHLVIGVDALTDPFRAVGVGCAKGDHPEIAATRMQIAVRFL